MKYIVGPIEELLAKSFTAEDRKVLYVAKCCGRVYVGVVKPSKCGTCPKELIVKELHA